MKYIYLSTSLLLIFACAKNDDAFEDLFRGGFIEFTEPIETSYNLLELADLSFTATLQDPNNNATSYSLTMTFRGVDYENFASVTSFPGTLTITGQQFLDATGLNASDVTTADKIDFVAIVTTPTGVYNGGTPSFDSSTNAVTGGDTSPRLFQGGFASRQAMSFSFTFFVPPPKKIRGTSFEEPFAAADPAEDYVRIAAPDDNGELLNIAGQRHVMHVATGTGVDNEIGFTAEFISNGEGGFSNEELGVTKKTEDVGSFLDGSQGYQLEDVDGLLRLTFDKVNVDAATKPSTGIQVAWFARSTGWESSDKLHIYAMVERVGGAMETIDLVDIDGDNLDDDGLEGLWQIADSGFLSNVTSYQLIIDGELNSGSEEFYYDRMLVYEPG